MLLPMQTTMPILNPHTHAQTHGHPHTHAHAYGHPHTHAHTHANPHTHVSYTYIINMHLHRHAPMP